MRSRAANRIAPQCSSSSVIAVSVVAGRVWDRAMSRTTPRTADWSRKNWSTRKSSGLLASMSNRPSRPGGEVFQVERHDHLGADADGGGKHMPVIRIREGQADDQVLVVGDHRGRQCGAHELA